MKVVINNKEFRGFDKVGVNQKYNAIASTFSIVSNRELFDYYLEYPICQIYDENDKLILTGNMFAPKVKSTSQPNDLIYSGYSLPGILEDSSIPIDSYPLQFDNLSLLEITEKLIKPFNISFNIIGNIFNDLNKRYDKVLADPGTSIKQFINDLASQRNIYLSNNELGELIFTRYERNKFLPTEFYEEGQPGLKEANLNINSQVMHSEITVIKQANKDNPDGYQTTINNPYVERYRPIVLISNSGDLTDINKAARNALSNELSNIKFNLKTTRYSRPGTTIELKAPSLRLNKSTELMVQSISFNKTTQDNDDYNLVCVLPDVYTNEPVKNIFK